MVDFKYHVVSIVAVFLALAVGIVLGTNVLSGDVLRNLKAQTSELRKDAQDLRTQNDAQLAQINGADGFAAAIEPLAVAGRLTGRSVVVVMLPGAPKAVRDSAAQALTDAGATITGEIDVSESFVDPTQADALDQLVTSLGGSVASAAPTTAAGSGATSDVTERAATLLADSLVGTENPDTSTAAANPIALPFVVPTTTPSPTADATGHPTGHPTTSVSPSHDTAATTPTPTSHSTRLVPTPTVGLLPTPGILQPVSSAAAPDVLSTESLAGLEKAGFIKVDQPLTAPASLAVVIAPSAPSKPDPSTAASDADLLQLVAAFPAAGGATVVAGADGSAEAGGFLAAVRGDSSVSKVVSGVDDADTAAGEIAMVLALQGVGDGQIGEYGTGPGAQGALPTASAS